MNEQQAHKILVVDDDHQLRRALGSILRARNYDVALAESGEQALSLATERRPDLVVLDLALPGMDGMTVCTSLRTWLQAPILVLSVRGEAADKIQALDLGADDYLSKPFVAGELLARVRALLRRADRSATPDPLIRIRDLDIDLARRRVTRNGDDVKLTRTEFDILALLAKHADRVVTVAQILREVWGHDYIDDVMTLRVHIGNLRKKIEVDRAVPRYIATEPGVGYCLVAELAARPV